MKDLVRKVAVAVATGGLVAQSMIVPAFGTIEVVVSGNGSESDNTVSVGSTTTTTVTQNNTANVENNVTASSNTGGNSADDNTGGDVSVDTGDAKTVVEVSTAVNSNEASVDCGGCPGDVKVEVSGNGTKSDNDVKLGLDNTKWVTQDNIANVKNDVKASANSGNNDADDNTGGNVDIDTGKATAVATVKTMANANVAHIGSSGDGALELLILGNGSESDNTLNVGLKNTVGIDQDNLANIINDVKVSANSGYNSADDNTGGDTSIDTGDAYAGALVDTMANFNLAHVEDCCELDGLVKVAGNGEKSDNDVNLGLASTLYAVQNNRYTCGDGYRLYDLLDWLPWKDDCDVNADANTGRNDADDNTGDPDGDPSIDTGDATTEVEVSTEANSNVFSTGDAMPDLPDWDMDMEGSMSWLVWLLFGSMSG